MNWLAIKGERSFKMKKIIYWIQVILWEIQDRLTADAAVLQQAAIEHENKAYIHILLHYTKILIHRGVGCALDWCWELNRRMTEPTTTSLRLGVTVPMGSGTCTHRHFSSLK